MKLSESLEKADELIYPRDTYRHDWGLIDVIYDFALEPVEWGKVLYKGKPCSAWGAMVNAYMVDKLSFKEIAKQLRESGS